MTEEFLLSSVDEHGGPLSHGTMVASVVAANAEGIADDDRIVPEDRHLGFRGIASGADVKVFAIDLWPTGANRAYNPATLEELGAYDPAITEIVSHVLSQDIDIVNVSVGFTGIVDNYTEEEIRTHFRNAIEKMAQGDATEKKILVWAAGNAHGTLCLPNVDNCVGGSTEPPLSLGTIDAVSVEFMPGLPARIEELRGHSIAAVAVGPDRDGDGYPEIASFSNRCGIAANWCIASPGEEVLVAEFGRKNAVPGSRGIGRHDGTSFAAPMVAGGLALMKQLFRGQIPNTELVERLFLTADKGGPYGNRAVYGQGMMDLGAATSPVGQVKLASGQSVDGRGYGLSSTFIRPGGAFGDSLMRSFAGREIVAFDSLGAPYWFGLSEFAEIDAGPSLSARLLSLLAHMPDREHDSARRTPALSRWIGAQDSPGRDAPRLQFGFLNAPSGAGDGHFSLARGALTVAVDDGDGLNVAALTTAGGARRSPVTGLAVSRRPFGLPIGVRAGWLAERESLLGTGTGGGFGRLSADTAFVGVETEFAAGEWQLHAEVEIGTATPHPYGGLVRDMSSLTTSAFAFGGNRRMTGYDTLTAMLSQPLRVETGRATFMVPVARTRTGDVLRPPLTADLTPSGRQLDFSVRWVRSLAPDGELSVDVTWTRNPGHSAHAESSGSVLAGWRVSF